MPNSVASPPHTPTSSTSPGRTAWFALAFIVIAQLMVILDATIVNVALPAAQSDLQFGDADRRWIITSYALAFGSLLLLGGRLVDLLGQKRAFLCGLVGFALASAVGGFAPSLELLILARAAQGAFGALLAPAALALITTMFPAGQDRARAFGIFGAVAASGGALGMLLGGVLTEFLSWRWCMFVNVAFAAVALIGGAVLLTHGRAASLPRFDIAGFVTSTTGVVAIVYGFAQAEHDGWGNAMTLGSLVAGVILVAAFVQIERRVNHPLLPLRVILDRDRAGAMLAMALTNMGLFALFLFLTYYLQITLGFSALATGVAFVPFPLAIIVSSTYLSGLLVPRYGPRTVIVTGALVAVAGLAILQAIAVDSSYFATVLPALVVIGLGVGLLYTAAISTSTLGVEATDVGVASATVNVAQQVGGSIGTALLSSIYGSAVAAYLADRATTANVQDAAAVYGYHVAFAAAGAALLAVALVSGLLVRRTRDRPETDTHSEALVVSH